MTPRGESIKTELIRVRTLLANTEFTPVAETPDEVSSREPPAADEVSGAGASDREHFSVRRQLYT